VTTSWSLTIDCRDPGTVARFWAVALGYVERPPPAGWDSWAAWFRHFDVPEEDWGDVATLCDPDGVLAPISLLRVPERKVVKNRIHLDLQVSGGRAEPDHVRRPRIEAMVAALTAAGGTVLAAYEHDGVLDHVTMADPEGNELCIV
jgi:hypothetical protein